MRLDANVQKVGAAGGGGYFFGGSPHGPGLQRALCAAPRFACCSPNKPASNEPATSPAARQPSKRNQSASQPASRTGPRPPLHNIAENQNTSTHAHLLLLSPFCARCTPSLKLATTALTCPHSSSPTRPNASESATEPPTSQRGRNHRLP